MDGEKGDQIDEVNMQKRLRSFVLVDTEFKMEKKKKWNEGEKLNALRYMTV